MDSRRNNSFYHVVRLRVNHNGRTGREHQRGTDTGVSNPSGIRSVLVGKLRGRGLLRHVSTLVVKHERCVRVAAIGAILGMTATLHAATTMPGECVPVQSTYLMSDLCNIAGPAAEWSILGGSLLIGSWYAWNMARRAARS